MNDLPELNHLYIDGLSLDSLDISLGALPQLEFLELNSSRFNLDASEFSAELLHLSLNGIQFDEPELIQNIPNLQHLTIRGCGLSNIDLGFADNLEYADLNYNELASINIPSSTKLRYLDLSRNNLNSISLVNLPALEYFNIGFNEELSVLNLEGLPMRLSVLCTW